MKIPLVQPIWKLENVMEGDIRKKGVPRRTENVEGKKNL